MSLRESERARVTRIVAEEVDARAARRPQGHQRRLRRRQPVGHRPRARGQGGRRRRHSADAAAPLAALRAQQRRGGRVHRRRGRGRGHRHRHPPVSGLDQGGLYAQGNAGDGEDSAGEVHQDGHARHGPLAVGLRAAQGGPPRPVASSPATTSTCCRPCSKPATAR